MPELSWRHDGRNITLDVAIFRPIQTTDLTHIRAKALLDTGSTASGIGSRVIDQLGLASYGKRFLKSATDEGPVAYFLFRLGIYEIERDDLSHDRSPSHPYIFPEIDGFSWSRHADFDVILGMDVLRRCDFSMARDGTCRLAFG